VILVFSRDSTLLDSITAALSGLPATFESDREQFSELIALARVVILIIPRLDDDAEIAWLRRLAAPHPGNTWILVTLAELENVAHLIDWRGVSEVMWIEQVSRNLRPIVKNLLSADPCSRFAELLQAVGMPSDELVEFLRRACLAWPLPSTVKGLCRALGVKEDRIRYLWPRFFLTGHGPKEFLDILVLVRSFGLKDANGSWANVAKLLRIRTATLSDICRRTTGLRLTEAHEQARGGGRDFLQEWWLSSRVS